MSDMPTEVPKWFDDPEAPWPCPCGRPPFGEMVQFESEDGSTMLVHMECALAGGAFSVEQDDGS